MGGLEIVMDPERREAYLKMLLELDGLSHVHEDPRAAYCAISLTSTPKEVKPFILERQRILIKKVLEPAGLDAYDPATAPYSPDVNLNALPEEIYRVDSSRIVGARFFVAHCVIPSYGQGIEAEKAKTYNRISVALMDASIRVSRMQPHRTIYLQYGNFSDEAPAFVPVFDFLRGFDPGMGFRRIGPRRRIPVLLGFEKGTGRVVDLEEEVYRAFPDLQYRYEGETPISRLRAENPELFYEYTNHEE